MTIPRPSRVTMLTRELNSYRIGFFEESRRLLAEDNIDFRLLVGGATSADRSKNDAAQLSWAQQHPARELTIRGRELWWQPVLGPARRSDLVITEQASKQLANIPLSLMQRAGRTRHCLWGHGRNFQASIEGASGEGLKEWFTRSAHWFFSYTDASTQALTEVGFPAGRITTFNNSTDVASIRTTQSSLPADNEEQIRRKLRLGPGPVVGYLGALYAPKRTGFLLESLDELRTLVPDVQVIVVGGGAEEHLVRTHAKTRPWLHPLGALYGSERVSYISVCSMLLMPGMVGLNVVDGFALGLPTITTGIDYHSPEISYLEHGVNGWVSPAASTALEYASDISTVLADHVLLNELQAGACETGDRLGIEQMAVRFAAGIRSALDVPRR